MWDTRTYWFDIALIMGIFAVGNILLGHFEEHRPKWRRLLKVALVLSFSLGFSYLQLRWVTGVVLGIIAVAAAYIHLVWLPRHGVNGWTGEPKQKYFELIGVTRSTERSTPENVG
jgi:hypothetical protein